VYPARCNGAESSIIDISEPDFPNGSSFSSRLIASYSHGMQDVHCETIQVASESGYSRRRAIRSLRRTGIEEVKEFEAEQRGRQTWREEA